LPGIVEGYTQSGDGRHSDIVITGVAREGDSGGPILNAQGELIGVIWGQDGTSSRGAFNGRVCQFVATEKYSLPWTDKLTPWNARTEQEKIRAQSQIEQEKMRVDAGAYDRTPLPVPPPQLPFGPPVPMEGMVMVDSTAREMAREAMNRIDKLIAEMEAVDKDTDAAIGTTTQAATKAAEAAAKAVEKADETAEELTSVKGGILATVKTYTWDLLKAWGMPGGIVFAGLFGLAFFLIRQQGMRLAQAFDKLTDMIPGNWDDKILDPLMYKLAGKLSGKPIPTYANTPGMDPWGNWYPGQQPQTPPPPIQPDTPQVSPEVAVLQAKNAVLEAAGKTI